MGTKVNPSIFKIEYSYNWNSKYMEKKYNETPLNNFSDLEIRKFINKFFKDHGLIVQTCKLFHNIESLNIFVSYYKTDKAFTVIKRKRKKLRIAWKDIKQSKFRSKQIRDKAGTKYSGAFFKLRKHLKKYYYYKMLKYNQTIAINEKKELKAKGIKLLNRKRSRKIQRKKRAKYIKVALSQLKFRNSANIFKNRFLDKLLEGIKLFTNKKIQLTVKQLNLKLEDYFFKNDKEKYALSTVLRKVDRFKNNKFFKKGLTMLMLCVIKKKLNTSDLLANYIAQQLQHLKKHNYFLKFLKAALKNFMTKYSKEIKGIFIKIKGRFNGAPRARKRVINIGVKVPVQTIKTDVRYSLTTAFNVNGTFGVKVFLYRRKKKKSKKKIDKRKCLLMKQD